MGLFTAVVIAADDIRLHHLQNVVLAWGQLEVFRAFGGYPPAFEVARLLSTIHPEVVLLDLNDRETALQMAEHIHEELPQAAIVGVGGQAGGSWDAPRTGIVWVTGYPLQPGDLPVAVEGAIHAVRGGVVENLYVFLPAKAGSGASTVALHTAAALHGAFGKRCLVMECDLRSGALSVALNTDPVRSIQAALDKSRELDVFQWADHVTTADGVDYLLSNRRNSPRLPEWTDYFALLEFSRSRYDALVADLPELVNPATAELVRRARRVFVVCTQEVLSLKLAQRRIEELDGWGIPADRVKLVVNRWHRDEMSAPEIEQLLGRTVEAAIPNQYQELRKAAINGRPAPLESSLGRTFAAFAGSLVGAEPPAAGKLDKLKSWRPFSRA